MESNGVACNHFLLLCQLHVVVAGDILPGHHALHPPVVLQAQKEFNLLSWHLYVAFNFLER